MRIKDVLHFLLPLSSFEPVEGSLIFLPHRANHLRKTIHARLPYLLVDVHQVRIQTYRMFFVFL